MFDKDVGMQDDLMTEVHSYIVSFFFFSSRRRHTRFDCDWSSDVCSSDLAACAECTSPPAASEIHTAPIRWCRRWFASMSFLKSTAASFLRPETLRPNAQIGRASCRERV